MAGIEKGNTARGFMKVVGGISSRASRRFFFCRLWQKAAGNCCGFSYDSARRAVPKLLNGETQTQAIQRPISKWQRSIDDRRSISYSGRSQVTCEWLSFAEKNPRRGELVQQKGRENLPRKPRFRGTAKVPGAEFRERRFGGAEVSDSSARIQVPEGVKFRGSRSSLSGLRAEGYA